MTKNPTEAENMATLRELLEHVKRETAREKSMGKKQLTQWWFEGDPKTRTFTLCRSPAGIEEENEHHH